MTTSSTEAMTTAQARLDRAGVPPRHRSASFRSWTIRKGTDEAHGTALAWGSDASEHNGGLVLVGPPGTGKTHLAIAALRLRLEVAAIAYDDGPVRARMLHAHYEVVPLLLDRMRAAVRYSESETEERFAHYRDECPLLVLDDLGREKVTDWVADRLYVLIESRYGRRLPTVVTTNLTLDELAGNGYGALVSRLTETCRFALTTAQDYRPTKGKELT